MISIILRPDVCSLSQLPFSHLPRPDGKTGIREHSRDCTGAGTVQPSSQTGIKRNGKKICAYSSSIRTPISYKIYRYPIFGYSTVLLAWNGYRHPSSLSLLPNVIIPTLAQHCTAHTVHWYSTVPRQGQSIESTQGFSKRLSFLSPFMYLSALGNPFLEERKKNVSPFSFFLFFCSDLR